MAKFEIPAALKSDVPENKWGKVLAATPVVLTVVATLLAGLSTGEMTRAQYDRSLAAQQQSKAGDQWSYFQAKRLRAALQRNTLDLLRVAGPVHPLDAVTLSARLAHTPAEVALASPGGLLVLQTLESGNLPPSGNPPTLDAPIAAALAAVDAGESDADVAALLAPIKPAVLAAALNAAGAHVRAFDATLKPVTTTVDVLDKELARASAAGYGEGLLRDFTAARLGFAAQRYDLESRQNQVIAQLYELQVRQSNLSAERHHRRSQRFFYGMLIAQMGVIISTFSLAARQRSFLWSLAAAAGISAVGFASYVYLFV
jgi:hypothetical protein